METAPSSEPVVASQDVGAIISARAVELGGVTKAATAWGVTPQMVHMVIKGARRPNAAMLADVGLEEIPATISYRWKAS